MAEDSQLQVAERVDAGPYSTLAIPATLQYLIRIRRAAELPAAVAFARQQRLPIFPLGDGSNIVFGADQLPLVAIKQETTGLTVRETTATHTDVAVAAGYRWDDFVRWAIEHNLAGVESLSIVPGTVGAAPVQNVGCYGQEVSETIRSLAAYDTEADQAVTLSNADCRFGYRDSLFKHPAGRRFVISEVVFRLLPGDEAPVPQYASLQAELDRQGVAGRPSLRQIREAVIAVRTSKLPDPSKLPTAGSFFHNPIVPAATYQRLAAEHPDLPHWPTAAGRVKLSAPWLIEACGLKGYEQDGVGMYERQAVVLINPGRRPAAAVLAMRDHVTAAVHDRFGVRLQMEPMLVLGKI